jgi:LacI family transcriptional regulator
MRKRATMKDVASLAGVSLKTVSRVVNRERGVSSELQDKVRRAVEQLDYRHNLAASNLRRGHQTKSIGILFHDLGNAFSATLLRAIEDRAREAGVAVLSASLDDSEQREATMAADLIARRVDGLVVMPTQGDLGYLVADIQAGLAVVAVDRPARGVDIDTVIVDNFAGAVTATRHLARHGHRRIACLTDRADIWTAGQRLEGYRRAVTDLGLRYRPELVAVDLTSEEAAEQAVRAMLDGPKPPTAVFAARNNLAVGTVRALRAAGRQHEVALIGFDDFPMADLLEPAVSVVAQDLAALGAEAARLLFARMDGGAGRTVVRQIPTRLIARGSGEIRRRARSTIR